MILLALGLLFFPRNLALQISRNDFPPNFILGAGTSAYQVEGAVSEDGRAPSIWDTFTHSGKMVDHSTADITADQYHKYKEDVKLMKEMGLDAYRFSISWSRLIPGGRGAVNPKGLQYYNNLINELISNGKTSKHMRMYASENLVIRVIYWVTLNEANIFAIGGYDQGLIAPGRFSGLPVVPWGLQAILEYLKRTYGNPPIFVHENGYGTLQTVKENDTARADYLNDYLESLLSAVRIGTNARGYFVWSFIDVFEVLGGYQGGYGLYGVNFEDKNLAQFPKYSAIWYFNFLKGNLTNTIKDGIQFSQPALHLSAH